MANNEAMNEGKNIHDQLAEIESQIKQMKESNSFPDFVIEYLERLHEDVKKYAEGELKKMRDAALIGFLKASVNGWWDDDGIDSDK